MTERELFEAWWDKAKHTFKCEYYDAYEIWQASASREGYKLVLVEKIDEIKRDADRMISSAHLYGDECHIRSFGKSILHIHKAMIGVVE